MGRRNDSSSSNLKLPEARCPTMNRVSPNRDCYDLKKIVVGRELVGVRICCALT